MAEEYVANDVATVKTDLPAFTVPVPKLVTNEVARRSLDKANIDRLWSM